MSNDAHRKSLIAKIHIAKTQLGLDDATYRAVLQRVTGAASSKDATTEKLAAMVNELKSHGFKDTAGFQPSKRADVRKVHALWGELKRQGKLVEPSRSALRAFCANQTGAAGASKDPEYLTPAECRKVIEALKSWADRAGAVN